MSWNEGNISFQNRALIELQWPFYKIMFAVADDGAVNIGHVLRLFMIGIASWQIQILFD